MSCQFYKWNGDYWCTKNNCRVTDSNYYKYCRNYGYSDCPTYKSGSSSGCYLTTIVCHVLNKQDNDYVLNTMRTFRDNYLQKDKKYEQLLKDYDNMGPIIAEWIMNDKNNQDIASKLYDNVLVKIASELDNKHYELAVTLYEDMTLELIKHYGLESLYNSLKGNNYYLETFDQSTSGHGIKQKHLEKLFAL